MRLLVRALGLLQKRAERSDGDAESAAGESIHVGGVDADHFTFGVEDRASAATVCSGSVVDEFVAHDIAKVSPGSRGTNE